MAQPGGGTCQAPGLRDRGVEVTTTVYAGAAHGSWWMDGVMSQAAELTDQLGGVLRGEAAGVAVRRR